MFVECLAEGRGVSLPAGSAGAARGVATAVGAYARIRKQFRVPIAEFGGIQEGTSYFVLDRLLLPSCPHMVESFSQLCPLRQVTASLPLQALI
jgi:acyl-CoA dehydrogenase